MSNFCPSCNATLKNNNALFCVNCGAVIGGQNFQNQELLQQHSNYLREFINNVNSESNNAKNITAPLAELDDTFQKANGLRSFLNNYKNVATNDINIDNFIKQVSNIDWLIYIRQDLINMLTISKFHSLFQRIVNICITIQLTEAK